MTETLSYLDNYNNPEEESLESQLEEEREAFLERNQREISRLAFASLAEKPTYDSYSTTEFTD